jgi:hypothetical protein
MLPPKVRQMHPAGLFPRLSPFADLAREGDKLIAGQWGGNKVTIWLELDAAPFGCHGPLAFRRDDNAVNHGLLSSAMCSLSGFHEIGSAAFIAIVDSAVEGIFELAPDFFCYVQYFPKLMIIRAAMEHRTLNHSRGHSFDLAFTRCQRAAEKWTRRDLGRSKFLIGSNRIIRSDESFFAGHNNVANRIS